jgi:AraC-like DNA-binding protein
MVAFWLGSTVQVCAGVSFVRSCELNCARDLAMHGELTRPRPLLQRFKVSDTQNADAFCEALAPVFGPTVAEPARGSEPFHAQLNICRLKRMAVGYGSFDHAFGMKIEDCTSFVHGFPIRGTGEHVNNGFAIQDSRRKGALGSPGPMSLSYGPNFEIFAIFIRPEALSNALSGLIGAPPSFQLKLEQSNYGSRPECRTLRRLVQLMIGELDNEDTNLPPLVLAELEQAILVSFLCGVDHNYSRLLEGRPSCAAPWQLRRVEEYIEANWDQPIAIEALAIVANASARSIFHSFKEHRGCSPMKFVKQVRLKHAREMLSTPAFGTTVTSVAFACGFGNLGHLANDYQQVFGEPPSATLNRGRGQSPR